MSRGMRSASAPRGPLTRTSSGSIVTSTPLGTGIGARPMRDIHHTSATTSPPTPAARASWPVITPLEVETIAVPIPP